MSFFAELKRRNVVRVGIAYVVVGWLVLQLTEVLSELLNLPETVGPIVVAVVAIGLPIALVFAWAYELTPEGVKREKDVDRSQSIAPQTGRKLDFVIIGVLVVALAYFVLDKFYLQSRAGPAASPDPEVATEASGPRTIAVLPLVNMSADAGNEYFSDGLTEELLNILAKIQDLRVAGRTSSFAFKGKNEDLRTIAEKLNVETLLEGSVRKDDARNRVRITLQLINAEDGYHLWSETYDRNLDDIFAIQEEVAHEVAAALRVTLLGEDEARLASQARTDFSAYELYLQGLEQLNEYSYTSLPLALEAFRQSRALDPSYIPAQIKEATTLLQMWATGLRRRDEVAAEAEPLLLGVIERDPRNDEALANLGRVFAIQRWTDKARETYRKALDINPRNVTALRALGRSHFNWGDVDLALQYLDEAERIDPYSGMLLWDLAFVHSIMQDVDAVDHYSDRIIELEPDNPNPHWGKALVRWLNGDLAEAQVHQFDGHEKDPSDYEFSAGIAELWLDLEDPERAAEWSRKADALGADQPVPTKVRIRLLQYQEQNELAADVARRALESGMDSRQGSDNVIRRTLLGHYYDQGRYDDALEILRNDIPLAFRQPAEYRTDVPFDAQQHLEAGILLKAIDPDSHQAQAFIDAANEKILLRDPRHRPALHLMERAGVAAARDDTEEALRLLEAAVDRGLRIGWRDHLQVSLYFRQLADEPRFQALVQRIEADMDAQRQQAHTLLEGRL